MVLVRRQQGSIRMALGQLLDYRRFVKQAPVRHRHHVRHGLRRYKFAGYEPTGRGNRIASDDGSAHVPVMFDQLEELKKVKETSGLPRKYSD